MRKPDSRFVDTEPPIMSDTLAEAREVARAADRRLAQALQNGEGQ
jgi:hypothetical protein